MPSPIDYEFRIFSTCKILPYLWASSKTDMIIMEDDYQDLMDMILNNYPELKNIKYLKERLKFYSIIELLNNYKNTKNKDRLEEVRELIKIINHC